MLRCEFLFLVDKAVFCLDFLLGNTLVAVLHFICLREKKL